MVTAYCGFLVGQERCGAVPKHRGHPVYRRLGEREGYAEAAPFAMGKFALRGLAQSMSEASPKGITGACRDRWRHQERAPCRGPDRPASMLDPQAIAASYLHLSISPTACGRRTGTAPWVEKF